MRRSALTLLFVIFLLPLAGCQKQPHVDPEMLDQYKVQRTTDEVRKGDFIFRLASEKAEYHTDEPVHVYGEVEYTGEKKEVTIAHSASVMLFPMDEKIREYHIDSGMKEIGKTTILKSGEPYREEYSKQPPLNMDEDPAYQDFADQFMEGAGFPMGYYQVHGYADFFIKSSDDEGEYVRIEANIDFKVAEQQ